MKFFLPAYFCVVVTSLTACGGSGDATPVASEIGTGAPVLTATSTR